MIPLTLGQEASQRAGIPSNAGSDYLSQILTGQQAPLPGSTPPASLAGPNRQILPPIPGPSFPVAGTAPPVASPVASVPAPEVPPPDFGPYPDLGSLRNGYFVPELRHVPQFDSKGVYRSTTPGAQNEKGQFRNMQFGFDRGGILKDPNFRTSGFG